MFARLPILQLGIVFLLAFGSIGFAQERPVAILLDEHGEIPCDETLGRIDVFFSELSNNPSWTGLIVISSRPREKNRSVFRQSIVESLTKWRGFDGTRFRVVRASSNEDLKVQFWRIPPGSNEPHIQGLDMSYTLPPDIKPFILGYETKFGDQICPEVDDARIFADFLKNNPAARANIVVRDRSKLKARGKASRIVKTFETKYGIQLSRLRTFTEPLRSGPYDDEDIVEYWYLP